MKKIRNKNISYKKKHLFLNEFENQDYLKLDFNKNNNHIIGRQMKELKYLSKNIMKYLKKKKDKLEKK